MAAENRENLTSRRPKEFAKGCYKQLQGTTTGSPFEHAFAYLFLCYLEKDNVQSNASVFLFYRHLRVLLLHFTERKKYVIKILNALPTKKPFRVFVFLTPKHHKTKNTFITTV